ncbi:DndE family protein [Rhodocytophaga rosea]|uniref:DndE family protein n=2 Tax=Rhodocytophaga rosea TaxID=2704465 RepID=A0A6C0GWV6_9BACT|nr:DndE family protein [Rhodocytophaga rosea]
MFNSIKTSANNKIIVTDLTRKLALGPENVIARIAFAYSLSKNIKLSVSDLKDSKGKEYNKNVLFGQYLTYYIALICTHYNLYKTDKDIPKYIKLHIDHGLELLDEEFRNNSNVTGFEFIVQKVENGLQNLI